MNEFTAANKFYVLHFLIQKMHICANLQYINKIVPLTALERVPGGPNFLVGLLNLAGKSVPVIDLAMRLGVNSNKKYSLDTSILLCSKDQLQLGLIVDEILGLKIVDENDFQMNEEFNKKDYLFFAVVNINSELVLLLNMDNIISNPLVSEASLPLDKKIVDKVTVKYE